MVELDAAQVLTFPQVFKAREVVRRGFLSNLLFDNVAGIFRFSEHFIEILDKLPKANAGKLKTGEGVAMSEPLPVVDADGNAHVDTETVINPKLEGLGKPVWRIEDVAPVSDTPHRQVAKQVASIVAEKLRPTREKLKIEYGLTSKQIQRDEKATEGQVTAVVERTVMEHQIAKKHIEAELAKAATEAEAQALQARAVKLNQSFQSDILAAVTTITDEVAKGIITREETKKEQTRADDAIADARAHLRGFARTIPMFLMAYGTRDMTLANFDDHTPDDVFEEITGITEDEFRTLRDGQDITEEDGTITHIPGLFDEAVFNQAIQEFLTKKEDLADYFDDTLTEDIFAYIPQQKTSLVFTPQKVVTIMVEELEKQNPDIFNDPDKTFADLFSTAGLFLMELVRRLDNGLAQKIPDKEERLKHILTNQIFEMSHNEILHRITIEAVSGGIEERKRWMEDSGHYNVGNVADMTPEERQDLVDELLNRSN